MSDFCWSQQQNGIHRRRSTDQGLWQNRLSRRFVYSQLLADIVYSSIVVLVVSIYHVTRSIFLSNLGRPSFSFLKELLSQKLMLCTTVFIFTSGSSALLGRPHICGLSIWLSLLAIFNTLFWVYINFFFHEKKDKTRKYSKAAIFIRCENGCQRLLGAQSINTYCRESALFNRELGRIILCL